ARLVAVAGATLLLAPGRHRVATTRRAALATTVGVVDRVHHDAADGRANALPAAAAGLAPVDVRLLGVADGADGGAAADVDHAHFARGHAQGGVLALAGDELDRGTGRAAELGAAAGAELHGVDRGADRHLAELEVVAGLDVTAETG